MWKANNEQYRIPGGNGELADQNIRYPEDSRNVSGIPVVFSHMFLLEIPTTSPCGFTFERYSSKVSCGCGEFYKYLGSIHRLRKLRNTPVAHFLQVVMSQNLTQNTSSALM